MIKVSHMRQQHGVGQGGFHSAYVHANVNGVRFRYDYVYDCGALKAGKPTPELDHHVRRYRPRKDRSGKYVLDALVLSHFDYDHMNGAREIAETCQVEQIFLPALTIELLALEIARQASALSGTHLRDLFGVAHGGTLWGTPVVAIHRGGGGRDIPEPGREADPPDGRSGPDDDGTAFPKPMVAVDRRTRKPLGSRISHSTPVALYSAGTEIWHMKFWNQEISDDLTVYVLAMMDAVGFPLAALEDPAGAQTVSSWLSQKANRDNLVDAYRHGYEMFLGEPLRGQAKSSFANYISMAMFSGPPVPGTTKASGLSMRVSAGHEYWSYSGPPYWFYPERPHWLWGTRVAMDRAGWLGTGDAMLGAKDIWSDFTDHFRDELPTLLTALLPHHGAAPKAGPRFYRPELSRIAPINVLSFGVRNTYRHPAASVVTSIVRSGCRCVLVDGQHAGSYFEKVTATW